MNLSELIRRYGDDKIELQNLDECTHTLDMRKGTTWIKFGTEQPLTMNGMEKLGLVVWLDRKRVAAIFAEEKMEAPAPPEAISRPDQPGEPGE